MSPSQIIFIFAGVITIFFGISNKGINSRRMQRLARYIGEVPTRVVYVLFGIALIIVAFTVNLGTI